MEALEALVKNREKDQSEIFDLKQFVSKFDDERRQRKNEKTALEKVDRRFTILMSIFFRTSLSWRIITRKKSMNCIRFVFDVFILSDIDKIGYPLHENRKFVHQKYGRNIR